MRVLITNSLVLAAISLAPAVAAAPYAGSSVDSYESYPNSTALAQGSDPSSVPNARRDDVFRVESFYDDAGSANFFGPFAKFFTGMGLNAFPNDPSSMPLTEDQKNALEWLHDGLTDVASDVTKKLPSGLSSSLPVPRSPEVPQLVNPTVPCSILSVLGTRVVQLLGSAGLGEGPTTPQRELLIQKLQAAIEGVVAEVAAKPNPSKLDVLPFNHARSVQERSIQSIVSAISENQVIGPVLKPITTILDTVTGGNVPGDAKEEMLTILQPKLDKLFQDAEEHVATFHTQHDREEHEHWDHHEHHEPHTDDNRDRHEPHRDDRHSDDKHKHDDNSWEAHKDDKSRGAQQDDSKPRDAHEDGHKSPDVHSKDRHAHSPDREGDHCREPRDGSWDESRKSDDCKHHDDRKDWKEDPSLLKISLGNSHHH